MVESKGLKSNLHNYMDRPKGAECFAAIRGFISTKVKQELNAFQAIQAEWC
jgi:hypothetical protein